MQIGYQTIIWGHWIDNIEGALNVIAETGFSGVEFAQPVDQLGDPDDLRELLRRYDLLSFA